MMKKILSKVKINKNAKRTMMLSGQIVLVCVALVFGFFSSAKKSNSNMEDMPEIEIAQNTPSQDAISSESIADDLQIDNSNEPVNGEVLKQKAIEHKSRAKKKEEKKLTPAQLLDRKRKSAVNLAKSYVGKISYLWGGKSSDSDIEGKTEPVRLDCSGFIQFVVSRIEGQRVGVLGATISTAGLPRITERELKVGDIGLKKGDGTHYYDVDGKAYAEESAAINGQKKKYKKAKKEYDSLIETKETLEEELSACKEDPEASKADIKAYGVEIKNVEKLIKKKKEEVDKYKKGKIKSSIDHVGIYCGKDKDGNRLWCHCSSSKNGVVCEPYPAFEHYFRYFS